VVLKGLKDDGIRCRVTTKNYYAIEEQSITSDQYIAFLAKVWSLHPCPIVLVADHASFHGSRKVRDVVRAHRHQIRVFFLPKHAPTLNPDEQFWNEIKHRKLGREPILNKDDLYHRPRSSLCQLKNDTKQLFSFFQLDDTKYVLNPIP
jgi:transposase